jgi:uncharacterized protein
MAKRTLIAFAIIVLLCAGALFGAGHLLSAPVHHRVGNPPADLFATSILIPNKQGYVAGWVTRGTGRGAILLLHGVRGDRREMLGRAVFLNRLGYTVVLVDLPAHGESWGKRITFGAHEADGVREVLAWMAKNLPGERIGVIGSSLGAASLVLSDPGSNVDALVVEAMYPTIDEAVENRLAMRLGTHGKWLAPLLVQQIPLWSGVPVEALRPVDAMTRLRCPVLVLGGTMDRHTTVDDTKRVFAAAPEAKRLWLVEGAAHIDLHGYNPVLYEERVGAFMEAALRK